MSHPAKHRTVPSARRPRHLSGRLRSRRGRGPAVGVAAIAAVAVVAATLGTGGVAAADDYVSGGTIARDDFAGVSSTAWSTPSIGGSWTVDTPGAFRLDGATGQVALPKAGSSAAAVLSGVSVGDVDARATILLPVLPRDRAAYAGIQVRKSGSTYYMAQLRTTASGAATVSVLRVNGSTARQTWVVQDRPAVAGIAAGTRIALQIRVTGTDPVTVRARAWKEGVPTPEWQAAGTDTSTARITRPGAVALWSYSSATSGVTDFSWDDLRVDSLSRTVPGAGSPDDDPSPTASVSPSPTRSTAPPSDPTADPTPPEGGNDPGPAPTVPAVDVSGVRHAVGARTIGTTRYPVPDNAIFASATASAGGDGSQRSPFTSIQRAIDAAPSGSTVVIRGGRYHESITIPSGKTLTLQPYPGEAVWLDGSSPVSGFQRTGGAWAVNGWTTRFDSSPTYTRGARDGSGAFGFVGGAYPMAAHPDQVWVDGVAQEQVASFASLKPGRFFVDYAAQKLYLGSDPTDRSVRASTLVKALTVAGSGSVVRGIGVLRYAPSVPDMGAIVVTGRDVTIQDVSITDSATTGLAMLSTGGVVDRVTVSRNGLIGFQANYADGLRVSRLLSTDNNIEHFNRAPVSGGAKITRSRGVVVQDSAILRNHGHGLWFDESVYNATVTGNDMIGNEGTGISQELSSVFVIADNVAADNGQTGINIADSNQSQVWNNSVSGSPRLINVIQGDRRAANLSTPGHDPRQKLPDPTVTWVMGDVTVKNNVLAGATGTCLLCVEDYSRQQSAAQARIVADGNVYQRASGRSPAWAVVWSSGPGNPAVFTSIAAFVSVTGQERSGRGLDGTPVLGPMGQALGPVLGLAEEVAQPLPDAIADSIGRPPLVRHLGAFAA